MRQADAGLLWSRQFYGYVVEHWLEGDPAAANAARRAAERPQPEVDAPLRPGRHLDAR